MSNAFSDDSAWRIEIKKLFLKKEANCGYVKNFTPINVVWMIAVKDW